MQYRFSQFLATLAALLFTSAVVMAEPVWIDVRTAEEHAQDNIPGDLNIDVKNIHTEIARHVADKNTQIMLYCRSGRRSEMARQHLLQMGYTNVTNVGSIADARLAKKQAAEKATITSDKPAAGDTQTCTAAGC